MLFFRFLFSRRDFMFRSCIICSENIISLQLADTIFRRIVDFPDDWWLIFAAPLETSLDAGFTLFPCATDDDAKKLPFTALYMRSGFIWGWAHFQVENWKFNNGKLLIIYCFTFKTSIWSHYKSSTNMKVHKSTGSRSTY